MPDPLSSVPASSLEKVDPRLTKLRREIDDLNTEILALLEERARIVAGIGAVKRQLGLPSRDPAREEEMIGRLSARGAVGPLRREDIRDIFRAVFRAALAHQERARLSGAEAHLADEEVVMTKTETKTEAPTPLSFKRGKEDRLFADNRELVEDFNFGARTAEVFDDMLDRSVPFYQEIQRMVAEMAADFAAGGTTVYDLGCSTANSFLQIDRALDPEREVRFVGVDSSREMLDLARRKLEGASFRHPFELVHGDLDQGVEIHDASVVLLVLTLQFIRPLNRDRLIQSIYEGLAENGCLLLVEKVLGENSTFNRLFIKHYYEMKRRNGYSEMEIAQKREALENVLIPYRLEENKELLKRHGFRHVDVFFKWYNFCAMVAMK